MSQVEALALNVGAAVLVLAPAFIRHVLLPARRDRRQNSRR